MVKIESMGADGWERVRDVRLAALLDTPDAFGRLHVEEVDREPAVWQERLASQDSVTFLAVEGAQDVGIVSVAKYSGKSHAAGIFSMWAAPGARGSGAASGLMEAAIAWVRAGNFERVLLEVGDGNARAIGFYARYGFKPTGATGTLPAPREHVTEHEMELRLRPA